MKPSREAFFTWPWQGRRVDCAATWCGTGPVALLLSVVSSIAPRHEMASLQACLAHRLTTVAVDWPGFGTADKPRMDWTPAAMSDFLAYLLHRLL